MTRAIGYVTWLVRHHALVMALGVVVTLVAAYLTAFHLPLKADFSHLLPQDAPSVRDLHALEARTDSQDTLLIIVESDDPAMRAEVAAELAAASRAMPPELVNRVEDDDAVTRAFLRDHRHLFIPLDDLKEAHAALEKRIANAKLAANPLYIDLEEEEHAAENAAAQKQLDELRARRAEAEARLDRSSYISSDGKDQLVIVRTSFMKTDAKLSRVLLDRLIAERSRILAEPGHQVVHVGFTAGVAVTVVEHEAMVRGIVLSSLVTALLVGLVLAAYFRSIRLLLILTAALVVGTAASFGVAAITVGHLNAATAFLGAIIAGNGVNYGILLIARYLEERREHPPEAAMAEAIHATLRPTIVASLGASIAYGSLAVTSFRGFSDFAVIGGIGMLLCWIATYTLVPAMVLRWGGRKEVKTSAPVIGRVLARVLGFRRPAVVCVVTGFLAIGAGVIAYRFVSGDPYEYDMRNLRSDGEDAIEARTWLAKSDKQFRSGIAGQTFVAAQRPDQIPQIVAALHKIDEGVPELEKTIGRIQSILDVVPQDQEAKIEELEAIRKLLDAEALDALSDEERAEIEPLIPAAKPKPIAPEDLPEELLSKLREKDGRVGLLVGVRPNIHLDEWNGKDLVRFATAIRRLRINDEETVTTSGVQVIYADILDSIRSDGPLVVGVASAGLILMVLLTVGRNLRAVAVLAATGLGSLLLVAVCAIFDVRVTFLDFVALPITLGIGVDYAINLAHRHHHGDDLDPVETLRYSGAAVFTCSLTTIIGYGSLLVSENLAIVGFGEASLIGEVCCLLTALVVVPAIVSLRHPARDIGEVSPEVGLGEEPPVAR